MFCDKHVFYDEWLLEPLTIYVFCRTTPCHLSVAAYSVYSQLLSLAEGCPSISNLRMLRAVVIRD
jgi:hypothetical protein